MANYGHVIFFSLIGGVISLIGGVFLLRYKGSAEKLARYATPFAAGALLAAVFLDLLHEGLELGEPQTVLVSCLMGLLIFFLAERFLHWFHHHHQHEGGDPSRSLIIIGDTAHNALDGVAIAAAFLISIPTGIVTTLAVAAHEIPQEIGDFGLLLHKGMRRRSVLLVNVVSALATTAMAVVTFALGSEDRLPLGVLLGLSAGFLLYIATSDIIPEIHEHAPKKKLFDIQPLLLILGVIVVGFTISYTHKALEIKDSTSPVSAMVNLCPSDNGLKQVYYDFHSTGHQPQETENCTSLPECESEPGTFEGQVRESPCLADFDPELYWLEDHQH